jgi:hypothetical protein
MLVCANDLNLPGDNIDTIKKNTETLVNTSKEVGLEVNTQKTKYTLLAHYQNAGQNRDINIANRCSESVAQSRYLRRTVANENYNLPMVLYGCETWSLTLKQVYRLRVLRRIVDLKRDEVTGDCMKLHKEDARGRTCGTNGGGVLV